MAELAPGLVGEASAIVGEGNLATDFGSGSVRVLGTPAMIGLMEAAAIAAVDHLLPEGQASVGTWLEVRHLAATPPGLRVRARAELIAVDGRKLRFRVEAFDEVEQIGAGEHERFVVMLDRFLARATAKQGASPA